MSKTIITAAITGSVHTPSMSPYLPITPKQIADEAVRSWDAGAAIAHIHVRDPETGAPSPSVDMFREVCQDVKSRCDIILCLSTGGGMGMTTEERLGTLPALKPELATFGGGALSATFHVMAPLLKDPKFEWETKYINDSEDWQVAFSFKQMRETCEFFRKHDVKPELEIYDLGQINNMAYMIQQGHLESPPYIQFVMGMMGGVQATFDNLTHLYKTAQSTFGEFGWSVLAGGRQQFRICTQGLLLGGNVRVGMEDNLWLEKGRMVKSNAEQVEKIVRIAGELGIEPATPTEAREILGLKGLDKVNY